MQFQVRLGMPGCTGELPLRQGQGLRWLRSELERLLPPAWRREGGRTSLDSHRMGRASGSIEIWQLHMQKHVFRPRKYDGCDLLKAASSCCILIVIGNERQVNTC